MVKYTIMSDSVAFLLMDQFAPNVNPHGCYLQAVGKLLNSLLIGLAKTVSVSLIHTARDVHPSKYRPFLCRTPVEGIYDPRLFVALNYFFQNESLVVHVFEAKTHYVTRWSL